MEKETVKIFCLVLFLFCLFSSPVFATQLLYDSLDSASTVAANNGTMSGVSFVAGKVGSAALINGAITYPYAGKFSQNAGTVQFLINPNDSGGMGLFESGALGYANSLGIFRTTMYDRTICALELRKNDSSYLQAWHDKDEVRLENGKWYMVTAVWQCNQGSNDFFQMYINNIPGYRHSGSSVCTDFFEPSTKQLRLGSTYWYGDGVGTYDELKIFDNVKTQAEITNDYYNYLGEITCTKNSDCGTNDWVDATSCSNNDVYQNYRTFTCNKPGTFEASCSHTDALKLKQDCGKTTYEAWSAPYCDGNNVEKSRTVHNKGCTSGACFANDTTEKQTIQTCQYGCANATCIVPNCKKNSDCGTDSFVGSAYCQNSNVFQDYRTYTCNNPDTAQANCTSNTVAQLKKTCQYDCTNGACTGVPNPNVNPIEWLSKNQDRFSTGLLESQVGFADHRAFIYDQALAAIAFTKANQPARAKKIFAKMKALQSPEGYWRSAFYAANGSVWEWNIDTGPIAWMIIALNYYESKTLDKSYASVAEKAIGWLESRIDKDVSHGSYGAVNLGENWWNVEHPEKAFGTEHQLDCYSAFKNRATLTSNSTLKARLNSEAQDILDYLIEQTWTGSRFNRGYNDSENWLDCQSWGVMALGATGPNGENFASALDNVYNNMRKTKNYSASVPAVNGFSYNNYQDTIWVEGTLQMAGAYYLLNDNVRGDYYSSEMERVVRSDGGLPYSFDESDTNEANWPMNLRYSAVSSIAWYYFAKEKFNPFNIESIQQREMKLDCPVAPVEDTYSFSWDKASFSTAYLQFDYNGNFKKIGLSIKGTISPTPIAKYYKTLIKLESKTPSKTLYARLYASDKTGKYASNVCSFTLKQPVAPEIVCPTEPIDANYLFSWSAGDYTKSNYLQFSYEQSFKHKKSINTTKNNPTPITKYWKTLYSYSTKNIEGKLFARIYATEKYGRKAYSNVCEFRVNAKPACSKNSDCGTDGFVGEASCSNGKIYQSYVSYACKSAGTLDAKCSSTTKSKVLESCKYGCTTWHNYCNPNPKEVPVYEFKSMPSTITTNMENFPVMGYADYGTKFSVNGSPAEEVSYDDSFFRIVKLVPGNNTITVKLSKGGTVSKNVVYDLDYSTQGKELLYINLWDYDSDNHEYYYYLLVFDATSNQYVGIIEGARALGISPNGKTAIVYKPDWGTRAMDTKNNKVSDTALSGVSGGYYSGEAKFSQDSSRLFINKSILDAETFQKTGTINAPAEVRENTLVSWDDSKLFFRQNDYDIGYYSLAEEKYYDKYNLYSYYTWSGMGLTKDGTKLAVTGCSWEIGYFGIFDVASGAKIKDFDDLPDCPATVFLSPDGKRMYLTFSGYPLVLDTETLLLETLTQMPHGSLVGIATDGALFSSHWNGFERHGIFVYTPVESGFKETKVFFISQSIKEAYYKPAATG